MHGVGEQPPDYYTNFSKSLIKKLSHKLSIKVAGPERFEFPNQGSVTIERYLLDGYQLVSIYAVHWSPITKESKSWLKDNHRIVTGRRSIVNNGLKKHVLNSNLSDFVMYTNRDYFRRKIQRPVRNTFLMAIRDTAPAAILEQNGMKKSETT